MHALVPVLILVQGLSLPGGPLPLAAQAPDTLTLEEALRLALVRSPELQLAEGLRIEVGAGRWESYGSFLPSVSVFSGIRQSEALQRTANDPITGGIVQLPDSLVEHRETFGTTAGISLNWLLFDGGRRINRARAARRQDGAAELALQVARVRVTAGVIASYLDVLEADAIAAAARAELDRARELERTARSRFDVGEIPELELLQAQLALSDAELALLEAGGTTRAARMTLLERVGLPLDPEVEVVPPREPRWPDDLETLRRSVLAESPTIRELDARLGAARMDARARGPQLLPTISGGMDWGRSEFGMSRDAFTLGPRNTQATLRLSVSWAPFERPGGVMGDRRRAEAAVISAEAAFQQGRAALDRELTAGLDELSRARAVRERVGVSVALAERQLAQAEERYRLGVAPLLERLAAQGLWADVARQEIAARHAPLRALLRIERATGTALWLAELR